MITTQFDTSAPTIIVFINFEFQPWPWSGIPLALHVLVLRVVLLTVPLLLLAVQVLLLAVQILLVVHVLKLLLTKMPKNCLLTKCPEGVRCSACWPFDPKASPFFVFLDMSNKKINSQCWAMAHLIVFAMDFRRSALKHFSA